MDNQIQVFKNSEFREVRTLIENGEPWFVAKDVAEKLGYSETSKMLRRLDDDEKADRPIWADSQNRTMTVINESGLYNAIIGSKLPSAKKFKKWVTSEVLPSIRNTGGYVAPQLGGLDGYVLNLAQGMQITNHVVSGILTTINNVQEFVKDSIIVKDDQIERTAEMIGLRDRNTKVLSSTLKDKISIITGRNISANSEVYKRMKLKVFKEFKVDKWEEIPIGDFNRVYAYIDTIDEI